MPNAMHQPPGKRPETEKEKALVPVGLDAFVSSFAINLSVIEWHLLLSELEYLQRFMNRDTATAKMLYANIVKQLR